MATIGNYKETYIKYNSNTESLPEYMPGTGEAIPEDTFAYDVATGTLYAYSNGEWIEQ